LPHLPPSASPSPSPACRAQLVALQRRSQQVSRAAQLAVRHEQRHRGLNKEYAKPAITRCARRHGHTQCNRETESYRVRNTESSRARHAAQAKSCGGHSSMHWIERSAPRNRAVLCLTSHRVWTPTPTPTPPIPPHVSHRRVGANIRGPGAQLSPEKRRIMQSSRRVGGSGRKSPHLRITRPGAPSRASKLPRGGAKDKNAGGSIAALAAAKNNGSAMLTWIWNGVLRHHHPGPTLCSLDPACRLRFWFPRLQLPPPWANGDAASIPSSRPNPRNRLATARLPLMTGDVPPATDLISPHDLACDARSRANPSLDVSQQEVPVAPGRSSR